MPVLPMASEMLFPFGRDGEVYVLCRSALCEVTDAARGAMERNCAMRRT